jgi:hypothetical protein
LNSFGIKRIPQDHGVRNKTQSTQLIFLLFPIPLSYFTPLAMTNDAGN